MEKDTKMLKNEDIPTKEEDDLMQQDFANSQARYYLASTDWMATREAETGVAMPADVKAKRAEARTAIV